MKKQNLPYGRRAELLRLLAQHGPLSVRGLKKIVHPSMEPRRIRESLRRLYNRGLVTKHCEGVLGRVLPFYQISREPSKVEMISQILDVTSESLERPYPRSQELLHWEECAVWAEYLKLLFPELKVYRESEFKQEPLIQRMLLIADHAPWPISESEALAILDVFEALEIYSKKVEEDPDYDFSHGEEKIAIFKKGGSTWKPTWKSIATLMKEPIDSLIQKPEPLNEILLQKLRSQNLRTGTVWEAAVFYLPSLIFDAERPYYPKACALVEEKTGYCIGVEIVRPEIDPISKLRNLAVERMAHFGYKPSAFRIQSPEL